MAQRAGKKLKSKTIAKESTSRQTSLLDAFGARFTKRKTPPISTAPSENSSVAGEDIICIPSSDTESLADLPVSYFSSPLTVYEDLSDNGDACSHAELNSGVGSSREAPILVTDTSPITFPKSQPKTKEYTKSSPRPLFSIFAPKKRPDERDSTPSKILSRATTVPAPFPDHANQHVRGPQLQAKVSLTQHTRREAIRTRPHAEEVISLYSRPNRIPEPILSSAGIYADAQAIPSEDFNTIPTHHRQYPAINRLLDQSTSDEASDNSNLLWNDKYRPKRADEVLGNEHSALYLRDWLLATKLHNHGADDAPASTQGSSTTKGKQKAKKHKNNTKGSRGVKRPRIIRDVERKRRRLDSEEPDDRWIANDDTDSDDPIDIIFASEDDFIGQPVSRLKRRCGDLSEIDSELPFIQETNDQSLGMLSDGIPPFSYEPTKFGETVGNTILLAGPSGCGKTAAVYACAEELGWEVFEVHPGIGERSGAALHKLIGDVGKNHLVKRSKANSQKKKAPAKLKHNFFAKRVVSDDETDVSEIPSHAVAQDPPPEPSQSEPTQVSQSVVLVEEVDILFREDANFWPTMIKIIKDCRRPVVMTCNDIHLVPTRDLPLQATLFFKPCPPALAASYLQLLHLAENGATTDTALASQLYQDLARNARQPDCPDSTLLSQRLPEMLPDLRRTINQLQIAVHEQRATDASINEPSPQSLKQIAMSLELYSLADSRLRRSDVDVLRELLVNGSSPCGDDVLGIKHLTAEPSDDSLSLPITLAAYHHDETILEELLYHARQHCPAADTPNLYPLHTLHCDTLLPIFDRLHVDRESLVRDPNAIFLDYEPSIRFMTRTDDAILANGQYESTTRRTRNSQRSQLEFHRWVSLNEGERDILYRTALEIDMPAELVPSA